ncbi:MAG: alpha/beta fold hydrolase [Pacificimonas sp.]
MIRALSIVASCLAVLVSTPSSADELAEAYGKLSAVTRVQLSPDGTKILYIAPTNDRDALVVADIDTGNANVVLRSAGTDFNIGRCLWARNDRVICNLNAITKIVGRRVSYNRVIALNSGGGDIISLSRTPTSRELSSGRDGGRFVSLLPDDPDHILMSAYQGEEIMVGTRVGNREGGLILARVNIDSGNFRRVSNPEREAAMFVTDAEGELLAKATYDINITGIERTLNYFFRAPGKNDWQRLGTGDMAGSSEFYLDGYDANATWLYLTRRTNGRDVLYRRRADQSGGEEVVFAHPDVDVGSLVRIGKYNRPVGVSYSTEYNHVEYFDPEIEKLSLALSKVIPGDQAVAILDESWNGKRKLVFSYSDVNAGTYYLYDSGTKELIKLSDARPEIADREMATSRPISYAAKDGIKIPGYLTVPAGRDAKNLPLIIMPHGGPSSRDTWGFDWLVQYLAGKGYAVIQPNYRGSAGYGADWYAKNGFQGWQKAMSDINDAARWAHAEGIGDPQKTAIVGWSYGGYAALQTSVLDPKLYDAIVAIAPVTDLQLLQRKANRDGEAKILRAMLGSGDIMRGGSPTRHAEKMEAPILMFQGTDDLNVDIEQPRAMADALKDAGKRHELVVYDGLEHSLVSSSARTDMLTKIGAFLDANVR